MGSSELDRVACSPVADAASARPIPVRRPKIDLLDPLAGPIPRHWWGGDPFKSHFLNALSSTFPFGEAFFVRSVRYYADRIDDPALVADIRAFAGRRKGGIMGDVATEHLLWTVLLIDLRDFPQAARD